MIPFSVRHLDHLVLRVRDLERTVAFYGAVLGCAVARRRDELGLVHLCAGSSLIDLVSIDGPLGRKGGGPAGPLGRNLDHLCLRVDPFDEAALLAHLALHGVSPGGPAQPRFGADGEGPSLYFNDPEGNTIELKGPRPTAAVAPDPVLLALMGRADPEEPAAASAGPNHPEGPEGSAEAAATACLHRFTDAFNAADVAAVDRELHFPHLMLAGGRCLRWDAPGQHPRDFFESLKASGWHHTRYEEIQPVLAGPGKVHFVVRYARCAGDGTVLSLHRNLWVAVLAGGRWGIVLRSY